jgi:hypothetical protein
MILLRRNEKDYTQQPANGLLTLLLFYLAIRHSRSWADAMVRQVNIKGTKAALATDKTASRHGIG